MDERTQEVKHSRFHDLNLFYPPSTTAIIYLLLIRSFIHFLQLRLLLFCYIILEYFIQMNDITLVLSVCFIVNSRTKVRLFATRVYLVYLLEIKACQFCTRWTSSDAAKIKTLSRSTFLANKAQQDYHHFSTTRLEQSQHHECHNQQNS